MQGRPKNQDLPPPGSRLGRFEILGRLGAGGMGEVLRGHDPVLGREVAIKVLPEAFADDRQRLARFEREARALATLSHPNVVTVHELGDASGRLFLVMELVEGVTLREAIPLGGFPLERLRPHALALADALIAAHDRGIVHRDLKPGNLMVTEDGRLKVLDFGLAKPLSGDVVEAEAVTEPLTGEGALVGTAPYMAPEQVRGEPADVRSDLFAAGVVLYEMATGHHPFPGASLPERVSSILHTTPPPASTLNPGLPMELDRVLRHCLEKEPLRRFQSARDLRYELQEVLSASSDSGVDGSATAVEDGSLSLVVLPFDNLSADPENAYFAAGITDEITAALARIDRLRVVAAPADSRADGEGIRALAHRLGVAFVLTGSVRKAGQQVRISARLLEAVDGVHKWTEVFQGALDDVFALQERTALAIAEGLDLELSGEQQMAVARRYTDDVEAYDAFLRARALMTHWDDAERLDAARRHLEKALVHDPDYPAALAALARVETEVYRNLEPDPVRLERAEELARRAVELAPDLSEARAAVGRVLGNRYDYRGAAEAFRRAQELAPDDPVPWDELSWALSYQTPPDAEGAEHAARQAIRLQPTMLGAHYHLGRALLLKGRLDEAASAFRHARELDATFDAPLLGLALVHLERGELDEARDVLARNRACVLSPPTIAAWGEICAARGEYDLAFEKLERALELGYRDFDHLEATPHLVALRGDPRWARLIRRYGETG